jgi:hypothetical protein
MVICVCDELRIVQIVFRIHIRSLFYEKLANAQVTSLRRQMQRDISTINSRIRTLKTKQKS